MTPAQARFWTRVMRRTATLTPDLAAALLAAFAILRDSLTGRDVDELVATTSPDRFVSTMLTDALFATAFLSYRARVQRTVRESITYFARDLPKQGKIGGVVGVGFDILNPKIIDAIRALDTKIIKALKADIRETVRATIEQGLRTGVNPRETARALRDVIGLPPSRSAYIENLRAELTEGRFADAARRTLLDRRFNLAKLDALSPAERAARIETIVERYRKGWIASTAETNARTATLDALKLGQRLTYDDAVAKGIVDGDRLMKTWRGVMDDREREEHVAMQDETVPYNQPFSNGEDVPGESTYNCRCLAFYSEGRAA